MRFQRMRKAGDNIENEEKSNFHFSEWQLTAKLTKKFMKITRSGGVSSNKISIASQLQASKNETRAITYFYIYTSPVRINRKSLSGEDPTITDNSLPQLFSVLLFCPFAQHKQVAVISAANHTPAPHNNPAPASQPHLWFGSGQESQPGTLPKAYL